MKNNKRKEPDSSINLLTNNVKGCSAFKRPNVLKDIKSSPDIKEEKEDKDLDLVDLVSGNYLLLITYEQFLITMKSKLLQNFMSEVISALRGFNRLYESKGIPASPLSISPSKQDQSKVP